MLIVRSVIVITEGADKYSQARGVLIFDELVKIIESEPEYFQNS